MRWATLFEGRWVFLVLLAGTFLPTLLTPWAALPGVLLLVFSLWFFRDPERTVPTDEAVLVAPADGRVTAVEAAETLPQGGSGWRISIFLSIFSVHVNRAPVAGKIIAREHRPGVFLDARDPDCALKNEAMTWTLQDARQRVVVVRQITGAIARRIVPWSQVGESVAKGHRFGMIRFGSRTDLYIPAEASPCVQVGESVAGASTVVARWDNA